MNIKGQKLIVALIAFAGLSLGEWRIAAVETLASHTNSSAASAAGSRIEFDSTILDFGKVAAGQLIEHNFIFTNRGDQTLEIKDVRPTCGCTIAGVWTRLVEPGNFGIIPIRYTSANINGEVTKTVIVECNDLKRTNVVLQLTGKIYEPVEVTSAYVMFGASVDCQTNQTKEVRIINHLDEPLLLSEPECAGHAFRALLKTVQPGKEYELEITLVPPLKSGSVTVPITLKTSSTNLPVIKITAVAVVQSSVMATPDQIVLAPGPLASGVESKVTIQNNRTKPLTLSEPTVNIAGVDLRLREVQPGRQFNLTASFPAGFKIAAGQSIQVQIKTSDPQFPVITVPVFQNRHLAEMLSASEHDLPPQKE